MRADMLASGGLAGLGGALAITLLGGCMETRRALGDACLKNDDCLSGICSQLRCDVLPPLTDARAVSDAGPLADAQDLDATLDSPEESPPEPTGAEPVGE